MEENMKKIWRKKSKFPLVSRRLPGMIGGKQGRGNKKWEKNYLFHNLESLPSEVELYKLYKSELQPPSKEWP